MPMIEFRYKPGKVSHEHAATIGAGLEGSLRLAIDYIRKEAGDYKVTVEGDPFGVITHNQPDLRIYIFYHDEWKFTPNDLDCLVAGLAQHVSCVFSKLDLNGVTAAIRFYSRAGHASAKIG